MPAVQRPLRSVDGYVDVHVATYTEDNLLATRLMHRAIANNPRIRCQQVFVETDDLAEMWRAGFLFAFKNKFDIQQRLDALSAQRVEGCENRHDAGFVV